MATQLFDYVFIAAMAGFGLAVGSLIVRLAGAPGRLRALVRTLGLIVRTAIPLGAAVDAIENLLSFPMLAQPETFANMWAIAHSTAAVIKFALIGLGMVALLGSVVGLAIIGLRRLASGTNSARSATLQGSALI